MFFADKPYVSDFFKKTVRDHAIPVAGLDAAKEMGLYPGTRVVSEDEAVEMVRGSQNPLLYATSENSIGWISERLGFTDIPRRIQVFKNKLKFRELTRGVFPDFRFRGAALEDLRKIAFEDLDMPLPFVIKPAAGFFSMGVHKVSNRREWTDAVDAIMEEVDQLRGLYPGEVLNTRSFIMEECVEGEEFAFDVYYDSDGGPVVLNIMKHFFSSNDDVSDRVYVSSADIIRDHLEAFTGFARKIGRAAGARRFPAHIELRKDSHGTLRPIEVNPLRFGGWCTTADMAFMAYGLNPYLCYYFQEKPDWPTLLKGKEGRVFGLVVLDNSTGIDGEDIASFDYDKLLSRFEKPLELRKTDFRKYPVFGFLFTETRGERFDELRRILNSDLKEFVTPRRGAG